MSSYLIVDDEPPARRRLARMLLAADPQLSLDEAGDGISALKKIAEHRPDAVFLDICMPGISGVELARGGEDFPPVVFVTAHDRYALSAFELNAVDYLLKPVESARLSDTLRRLRDLASREHDCAVPDLPAAGSEVLQRRLGVRTGDGIRFFDVSQITRIHAQDKYSCFDHGGEEFMVDDSLASLERRFERYGFCRVHRSELVNLNHVVSLPLCSADGEIMLSDGQFVRTSRRLLREIKRRLGVG